MTTTDITVRESPADSQEFDQSFWEWTSTRQKPWNDSAEKVALTLSWHDTIEVNRSDFFDRGTSLEANPNPSARVAPHDLFHFALNALRGRENTMKIHARIRDALLDLNEFRSTVGISENKRPSTSFPEVLLLSPRENPNSIFRHRTAVKNSRFGGMISEFIVDRLVSNGFLFEDAPFRSWSLSESAKYLPSTGLSSSEIGETVQNDLSAPYSGPSAEDLPALTRQNAFLRWIRSNRVEHAKGEFLGLRGVLWSNPRSSEGDDPFVEALADLLESYGETLVDAITELNDDGMLETEILARTLKTVARWGKDNGSRRHIALLLRCLSSKSARVRHASASSLGAVGDTEIIPIMEQALEAEANASVRRSIELALADITS